MTYVEPEEIQRLFDKFAKNDAWARSYEDGDVHVLVSTSFSRKEFRSMKKLLPKATWQRSAVVREGQVYVLNRTLTLRELSDGEPLI